MQPLEQLKFLAFKCGHDAEIEQTTILVNGKQTDRRRVVLTDNPAVDWNPLERNDQNHELLKTLISKCDCQLIYDDGYFFIYQFTDDLTDITNSMQTKRHLSHHEDLNHAVIDAAVQIWFPVCDEEEE